MPLSAASPCSAGVGRTGVFITLSIVLERMRYEGVVDIFQTVKMLRTQRPAMVQTEVRWGGQLGLAPRPPEPRFPPCCQWVFFRTCLGWKGISQLSTPAD